MSLPSNRPYFLRAIYEWLVDNAQTPYLVVDAEHEDVHIPQHLVDDGKIVLNISTTAVRDLDMSNEAIAFSARFSGRSMDVYVPINAVLGLVSREQGDGMFFRSKEGSESDVDSPDDQPPSSPSPGPKKLAKKNRPVFKVVK